MVFGAEAHLNLHSSLRSFIRSFSFSPATKVLVNTTILNVQVHTKYDHRYVLPQYRIKTGKHSNHEQMRYGLELLATAAISCAKGSAAAVVHQIVGIVHRRLRHSVLIVTVVYAIFAMFAAAFQCSGSAPRYWLYTPKACGNGALAYTVVVLNMITDLWLAVAPLPIIWRVQTTVPKRLRVMALLGGRIS